MPDRDTIESIRERRLRACTTVIGIALVALVAGEARLSLLKTVPADLPHPEAREFALASLQLSAEFFKFPEHLLLPRGRVLVVSSEPSDDAPSCGICSRGPGGVPCKASYSASVRYYTWLSLPYADFHVTCTSVSRHSPYISH